MTTTMPFAAQEVELLDEDFDGFDTVEEWDAYDAFDDDFEAQAALPPQPLDPELDAIISRLEAQWRDEL